MKRTVLSLVVTSLLALGTFFVAHADDHDKDRSNVVHFSAKLDGFQEVGALNAETGAILTDGKGTLKLTLHRDTATIDYEITFSGLTSAVLQSHIHFGRVNTPGGIMVFFCSNLAGAPAGTQACPSTGGTVTGSWTATNVRPVAGQNVTAGDFDALTDALFSKSAYANVHTTNFPAGEIRGQVKRDEDHDGDRR